VAIRHRRAVPPGCSRAVHSRPIWKPVVHFRYPGRPARVRPRRSRCRPAREFSSIPDLLQAYRTAVTHRGSTERGLAAAPCRRVIPPPTPIPPDPAAAGGRRPAARCLGTTSCEPPDARHRSVAPRARFARIRPFDKLSRTPRFCDGARCARWTRGAPASRRRQCGAFGGMGREPQTAGLRELPPTGRRWCFPPPATGGGRMDVSRADRAYQNGAARPTFYGPCTMRRR